MLNGQCLCGAVRLRISGEPFGVTACHCSQCRKMSGHFWASARVTDSELEVSGEVRWYAASDTAKRGFCAACGSSLLWKRMGEDFTSISLGVLDLPTGLKLEKHIFTADKGDYYDIADGLPQS